MTSPNILFILTDQQRADSLGCYGNSICQTPAVDALARRGVRFDNAYCATPICSPARASIQTGLFPSRHGIQSNIYTRGSAIHELADHHTLLSRRLQSLGYLTGYTGKWHMGFGDAPETQPEYQNHIRAMPALGRVRFKGCLPSSVGYEGDDFPGHGGIGTTTPQFRNYLSRSGFEFRTRTIHAPYPEVFEVLSGPESTVTHFLTEQAISHIDSFQQRGKPWFYMLNYWGPHAPYHAPTEYLDRYRDVPIPPWPSFDDRLTNKPSLHDAHRTETTVRWTWREYEEMLRVCYASITEIVHHVGRLVEMLRATGQLDNTILIFSSDHGDSIGAHRGLTDKSLFMYEETNRVPLIIVDPRESRRAGQVDDRFVGTCDLYSTVLDYAGLKRSDAELDGRSLRPLLDGSATSWRDSIVTECAGLDFILCTQRAIRWQRYKYVFTAGDCDELYDLKSDPHELINLAPLAEHAELLRSMRIKLDEWLGSLPDGLQERFRRMWLRDRF